MHLIKFKNEDGGEFLLHDGKNFVGGTKEECQKVCYQRIICSISAGFEVIEILDFDSLGKMIGFVPGIPYKILDFSNGLTHWMGVRII